MAMQRKWIQSATVAVDEETGALLVAGSVPASDGLQSSGTTASSTTDDNPVEVLPAEAGKGTQGVRVHNTGTAAGFFSIDGGTTWHHLPASYLIEWYVNLSSRPPVQIKRIAGGSNLSGVYAERW